MALTSRSYQLSAAPVTIFAHLLVMAVIILVLYLAHTLPTRPCFRISQEAENSKSIMAYQTVYARKRSQKAVHLLFHFIALVVGILGTYASFKFQDEIGLYNMFTLHSWLGIITICVFGLQLPGAEKSTKATLKPWHKFVGMVIFLLGICPAEIGLSRVGCFLGRAKKLLLFSFTGLLIFLFAVCISLSIILPRDD